MNEGSRLAKKIFWAVLAIKLLLVGGVYYFFGEERFIWSDSITYLELGEKIFKGAGFSDPLRMPFYPFILGAFFNLTAHGALFTAIFQAFFVAGSAVFVFKIGKRFLSNRSAALAALAVSIEPLASVLHLVLFPETILVFFILAATHFFLSYGEYGKARYLFYVALFIALAAWTKPVAAYLLSPFFLALIIWRRDFFRAAAFAVFVILLLLPWMFYNLKMHGSFSMTAQGKNNFCGYQLTSVFAAEYGMDPSDMNEAIFSPEFQKAKARCKGPADAFSIFLLEHPRAFLKTVVLSSLSFLTNDGYLVFLRGKEVSEVKLHNNYLTPAVFAASDWKAKILAAWNELGFAERAVALSGRMLWLLIAVFSATGMWIFLKQRESRMPALVLVLLFLYFAAVTILSTGFGVGARLRYPVSWIMIIFALAAVDKLYISRKNQGA